MAANEPGVIWLPNHNYFPDRNGFKPRYIILHSIAGTASAHSTAEYFAMTQGSSHPISSHYVIGQDGTVVQCVDERDGAWANGSLTSSHDAWWDPTGNPDNITISIEHCKPEDRSTLTSMQQASSFALIKQICQRHGIPTRAADALGGITGHFSIAPLTHANCPGSYPWQALWDFLNGPPDLGDPFIHHYFSDGGNGSWLCKNGVRIQGEVQIFYLRHGGPMLLGLPLCEEIHLSQYPDTAIMPCERGIICYDPQRRLENSSGQGPCYLLRIDQGIGLLIVLQYIAPVLNDLKQRLSQINQLSQVVR